MRLRTQGIVWVLGAALLAGLAVAAWAWSQAAWRAHLDAAWLAGFRLHGAVVRGADLPGGVALRPLPPDDPANRAGGVPEAAPGVFVTQVSLLDPVPGGGPGRAAVLVRVHSPDLAYPVAGVAGAEGPEAAFGNMARRPGGGAFPVEGPEELRRMVAAVNDYLAEERARLETRALVLSGVSHDLGTPATRLRLRTALIGDDALRARFESDIGAMTGMIEQVLTYTRAEIGAEPVRELSLTALVESVVADWQDTGRPVTYQPPEPPALETRPGLFGAGEPARVTVDAARRVLMRGRPLALQRALGNLIDNALKYGRRATVRVLASADQAVIEVQDEGHALTPEDLARLTDPFARGANAGLAPGVGLGLTIVTTIAAQHGGTLEYDQRPGGLCARLVLARG
jgi:signal transduction histidine kinase